MVSYTSFPKQTTSAITTHIYKSSESWGGLIINFDIGEYEMMPIHEIRCIPLYQTKDFDPFPESGEIDIQTLDFPSSTSSYSPMISIKKQENEIYTTVFSTSFKKSFSILPSHLPKRQSKIQIDISFLGYMYIEVISSAENTKQSKQPPITTDIKQDDSISLVTIDSRK